MTRTPLVISASPHMRAAESTPHIMWTVVASIVPVLATSVWFFGPSALLVVGASVAGALGTEYLMGKPHALLDGSALITGLLLGLTLPASIPMWMACVGAIFGIACGKTMFGGLGYNVFNPALLGRAFVQAAFPGSLTTWTALGGPWMQLRGDNFAVPFMSPNTVHTITSATPLGAMKFEHHGTALWDLVVGTTGGSLGETSGVVILICGAYLAWRKLLDWRIPAVILLTVAAFAQGLHAIDAVRYPDAAFHIFSGGLLLGAVFMATDPVTCPMTGRGRLIFSIGIGVLVIVIRIWGGLPEGVMYAILLMNALSPALNRATQPRVFGAT